MTYQCDKCEAKPFKTERGLLNHKCRYFCKVCGSQFATALGRDRHVNNHSKKQLRDAKKREREIIAKQQREEDAIKRQEELKEAVAQLKSMGLFTPTRKVGDKVFVAYYRVTGPTHVWRGTRHVRVRYEEVRSYDYSEVSIIGVVEPDNIYMVNRYIANNEQYPVQYVLNIGLAVPVGIFDSQQEAVAFIKEKQKQYKEACDHAAFCR